MDLDTPAAAPIELWHRVFLAQTHALLDPRDVAPARFADLPTQVLQPEGLAGRVRHPPRLVTLEALAWDRRLQLLDQADAHLREYGRPLFCALLACDDAPAARSHLQRVMRLVQPGVGPGWLRLHDPGVFRHLRWLLTPAQMACVMGPVVTWLWHEPVSGTWRAHARPAVVPSQGLHLQPAQMRDLAQIGVLNRCLRDLAQAGEGTGEGGVRALLDGIHEARAVGLDDPADLRLYACQRLRHGSGFQQRPDVRQRLAHFRSRGMSYVMACQYLRRNSNGQAA
ncbi:hypothetical protein ACLB90_08700 [Stenotrophomonas sp. LGBM10]|uniref:hypothetical protein n=1 Tax=Stenotrophomonas sp. LGBM10 TaxID=3390038 RepID=UPI00398AA8EF